MPACCILKCRARRNQNHPSLTLHRLPKNEFMKNKWLEAIGDEKLNFRHQQKRLCSLHFEESCFNKTLDVIRLRDNSIPTIFGLRDQDAVKKKVLPESKLVKKYVTVNCPRETAPASARDIINYQFLKRDYSPNTDLYPASEIEESMYDDDDDVQVIEKPLLAATSPAALPGTSELHEGIVCNICENEVVGYRYVCVECCDWDLCGQCEARAAHPQHYVLRVAHTREHEEVLRVVEAVRQTVRQARGELMSLQLEVSADEQREDKVEFVEDKEDIDLSLGLSVVTQDAPHYTLEDCEKETTISKPELPTIRIQDKVQEHYISDSTNLRVKQENDSHLSGDRHPIIIYKKTEFEHSRTNIIKPIRGYPLSNPMKGTSVISRPQKSLLSSVPKKPVDNCVLVKPNTISTEPRENPKLLRSFQMPRSTKKMCPKINIKIDNFNFFLHRKKLFGLARVKLKRLSEREVVAAMKRRRKTCPDPERLCIECALPQEHIIIPSNNRLY